MLSAHRRDIDDRPPLAAHLPDGLAQAKKSSAGTDRLHPVPLFDAHRHRLGLVAIGRIVHEDIERAKCRRTFREAALHRGFIRDVDRKRNGPVARRELFHRRAGGVAVEVRYRDLGAYIEEELCGCLAQA